MQIFFYIIALVTYTARSVFFMIGAARERCQTRVVNDDEPLVTVIVPARNEEGTIGDCVASLLNVDYPEHKLQIIIVNDRSTDNTEAVLTSIGERSGRLHIVHIRHDGEKNLRGKAGALDVGFKSATGDIVVLTDADCRVPPGWVRSHARQYKDPAVGLVCANTLVSGSTFFARIQAVEWYSLNTMASAAVFFKQHLGCYGNNMSVRRSVYNGIGGYAAIPFSVTEDLALLQAVAASGCTARYLCTPESSVTTLALRTMAEYIAQHKRWAFGGQKLGIRAVVFVATSLALWGGIFAAVTTGEWHWLALILAMRVAEDVLIIAPSLRILGGLSLIPFTIPAVLFFTLLELSLPFLIIDRTVQWKDQSFKM
ncbi:MAG: glycosyltransferase [Candidatus Kapaibacterium sp.]|jgi:1,2-diacylglycerol 3-beta-glucosyltransferase